MFNNSVISKTGQMWKIMVGSGALIIGSVAPAFEQTGMSWTVGTIIAVVGYGFAVVSISCPSCSQRWFYKALLDAGMYGPLFGKSACPDCQHEFG
jgi:hypothetical protein